MQNKLIFIFLDGVGLGKDEQLNPLTQVSMPTLFNLVGEKLTHTTNVSKPGLLAKGIDAILGVEGVPQSATGQSCLFTGYNAQSFLGYHLMAYPNDELIGIINKRSIFKHAKENNINSIFANSYTDGFFKAFDRKSTNYSVTTRCVLAGESKFNTLDDLIKGKAVHWDITNITLQDMPNNRVPLVAPFKAGENLKNIVNDYDLILFECFLPDLIGHRKDMEKSIQFFEVFDEFLSGILHDKPENVHILISSDHGNIEDLSYGGHSKNQVPLIVIGKEAHQFSDVQGIDEIFDTMFSKLFNVDSNK